MVKVKPSTEPKNLNKRKGALSKLNTKNPKLKKKSGRPRKLRRGQKKPKREPTGVVYLSHIPHGFYEDQIEGYFSQFGKVNNVSVPRSKSGRSKGYAFIEYRYPEVAKIAAETMNNYLMFNRLLKAQYIPPEKQRPHLFRIAKEARENRRTAADKAELAVKNKRMMKNRHLKMSVQAKLAKRLLSKKMKLMKRAEKLGIPHDFTVGETNLMSFFELKKEMDAEKKKKLESEEGDDSSEEQSSSSEDDSDSQSLGNDSSLHDDEDLTESEEENYKQIILKAKNASKDILKNASKPSKLEKVNKSIKMAKSIQNKSPTPVVKSTNTVVKNKENPKTVQKEEFPTNEDRTSKKIKSNETKDRKSLSQTVQFSADKTPTSIKKNKLSDKILKTKELNRSQVVFEVEDSEKDVVSKTSDENTSPNSISKSKNMTPKNKRKSMNEDSVSKKIKSVETKGRKSLKKTEEISIEKVPTANKKNKLSDKTSTSKELNKSQVEFEIEDINKEIVLKTPSDATKTLINTKGDSHKKTPKEKPARKSLLTPAKQNSSKKSSKETVSPEMSPRKKLRHRQSKRLSTSK